MRGKRKIAAFLTAVMLLSTAGTAYAESNVLGRPRAASSENMIEVTLDAKGGKFNDAETATGSTPDDASKSTANNAGKKVIELEVEGTDENGYEYAVWPNSPEYDFDVTHVSENGRKLEFGGWYYSLDDISTKVVAGETRLYHKTTLKAKWFMGEGAVVGEAAEEFEVKVKGLDTYDPEAALNVRYLSEEEKKTDIQLQNAVSGKGVKLDTKNAVQLDFDVPGGVKKEVEITMKIPTELDAEKKIYVLHFEKSGNVENVENTVNKASGEISFKLGSFSPVILVNGEAIDSDDMVSLTVKNVAGGYLYVTEEEGNYNTTKIFPIGEEVKIPAGTEVRIQGSPYWDNIPDGKTPALESVTVVRDSGNITIDEENLYRDLLTITEDTVLEGKFVLEEDGTDGSKGEPRFRIELDPEHLETEAVYSGKVVRVYNQEGRKEIPLSEVKLSVSKHQENRYQYDDTTKVLTSKDKLTYGSKSVNFDVTYQGKTYERRGYGYIDVGYSVYGYIPMIKDETEYWASANFAGGSTIKDVLAALADEKQDPFMHNYQFAGWADRKGNLYDKDDLTKQDRNLSVYAVFTKDGKKYEVKPIGIGEGGNEKPSKPSTGGSGSSVSSVGTHGVDRSAYDNTASHILKGTWEQTAQGWKFKTSSGSYASARWALINNEWYFFNDQGIMLTGWHFLNDRWFYLNQDPITGEGRMLTGWQQINGKWYYLNPVSDGNKGAMAADAWIGDWYVDASGAWIPEKAK